MASRFVLRGAASAASRSARRRDFLVAGQIPWAPLMDPPTGAFTRLGSVSAAAQVCPSVGPLSTPLPRLPVLTRIIPQLRIPSHLTVRNSVWFVWEAESFLVCISSWFILDLLCPRDWLRQLLACMHSYRFRM
jgi:hypothetical protein